MAERAAVRPVAIARHAAVFDDAADGAVRVRAPGPLGPYPARMTHWLEHWAAIAPDRPMLAERAPGGGWRELSYAQALAQARALGEALLGRGLSAERPVAVIAANGIAHAAVMLACMHVGVPCVPISPAYALAAGPGYAKLRHCLALVTPGLVFADDPARIAPALQAALAPGVEVAGLHGAGFAALLATPPTAAVDAAAARVGPGTIAKILFTSGSTGVPKGVVTTHRMLCSNQRMLREAFPMLAAAPPVLVDWLPWSHCFGSNHNLGLVMANGGTLHVDPGRPLPGAFAATVEALREVAPTIYLNVPKGYEELLRCLEADPGLRERFFSRVQILFYAAASLSQHVWDGMERLAVATTGQRIQWMTGLGCTETSPFALTCRSDVAGAGNVGLPAPGVELKLVPVGGKMEARVRGPNVTPGYWRDPAQTAAAFDEEGYFRMGDALLPADPGDRQRGFRFDGRIGEDFKLATGTWVSAGPLRARLVAALHPWVRDVVLAGRDCDYLSALAVAEAGTDIHDPATHAALRARLQALAEGAPGSASRVRRLAFLAAPLSIDSGELTDKGSINQRCVLDNHPAAVAALYAEPPPPGVICIQDATA